MSSLPQLPLFRFGRTYESLDRTLLSGFRHEESLAEIGQANPGLIRRDLKHVARAFATAQAVRIQHMIDVCRAAGELFLHGALPVSGNAVHAPEDYVAVLSRTCGLPQAICRANMEKNHAVLVNLPTILKGLTRGLDYGVLEDGWGHQGDSLVSYYPDTHCVGVVLPSNSPGVNALWLPAVALRIPVLLKPGREDPWTPWRLIQALLAAGCPAEMLAFYPTDHEGANTIIDGCGRAILFGDQQTVERYIGHPRVSVHGPGFSKVVIGEDRIDAWPEGLEAVVQSVGANSGRSCINASTVVVPRRGREVAQDLARRLGELEPRPLDDPDAKLAGFANRAVAEWTNGRLEEGLATPGAEEIEPHPDGRLVELDGITYLRPCVVYCSDPGHPLAKTELLFPYTAVVEIPSSQVAEWIGPSLVVSAITDDASLRSDLLRCRYIERLNLGPIATTVVEWDQPHEGNLFEFLYRRRAIQAG